MATIDTIREYFANILQRSGPEVTEEEINSYVSAVDSGVLTLAQVRLTMINSPEGRDVQDVVRLYQTVFGRVPDKEGLNDQVDTLRGPATEADLANSFANSPEFISRFGGNTVNPAFINAVYQQVLGRTPSTSEVQFYLESGFSAGRIALAFSESPEFQAAVSGAVTTFLDNAGQGTATYTGPLGGSFNVGESITLTDRIDAPGINEDQPGSGVDTSGTDGDDLYIGSSQTLNPGDVIDGNGGMDRIELTLGGEGITSDFNDSLASAEVETVQVTGVDGLGSLIFGGVFLDMLEALGVETVVNQSSRTYVELFDVQNMVDIEIRNVDFQEFSVYYDSDALGSAEAVQNVLVDDSFVRLNIGTDGDDVITTMNVEAVGAENALALNDDGGLELETLNITGSGTIAIGPNFGGTELNGLTTVDAGANTGGVLVDLRGNTEDVTVTGSSESDLIGLGFGGFTEDDMIDLGEGEFDQVIIDAGDISALDDNTLDDTVSLTGVEILGLDGSLDGDTTIELNDFEFTAVNIYSLNSAGAFVNAATPASGSQAFGFTSGDTSDAEAIADTYQGDTLTLDDADDQVVNVYGENNIQISFTSTDDAALQVGAASDLEAFVEIGEELNDFGYPSITLSQQQAGLEGASAFIDSLDLGNGVETGSLTLNGNLEIDTVIIGEDLESLTASGTGNLIINVGVGDSSNLETIDLSGLTGGFDNIGADPYGEQTFIIGDIGEIGGQTGADFGDGDVTSYSAIGLGDQAEGGAEFVLGVGVAPGASPNLGDGLQDVVEFTVDFDSNVAIFNFTDSSNGVTPDAATDDLLDFSALGIDYADLDIEQTDDGAAITSDAFGGAILLVGVEAIELTQNDFIF